MITRNNHFDRLFGIGLLKPIGRCERGWTTSPKKKKLRPVLFSRSPLDYVGFSSRGKDSSSMKLC